jgi:hypothetical protein
VLRIQALKSGEENALGIPSPQTGGKYRQFARHCFVWLGSLGLLSRTKLIKLNLRFIALTGLSKEAVYILPICTLPSFQPGGLALTPSNPPEKGPLSTFASPPAALCLRRLWPNKVWANTAASWATWTRRERCSRLRSSLVWTAASAQRLSPVARYCRAQLPRLFNCRIRRGKVAGSESAPFQG